MDGLQEGRDNIARALSTVREKLLVLIPAPPWEVLLSPELGKGREPHTFPSSYLRSEADFQVKMLLRLPHAFVHFQTADDVCQFCPKLLCRERIRETPLLTIARNPICAIASLLFMTLAFLALSSILQSK